MHQTAEHLRGGIDPADSTRMTGWRLFLPLAAVVVVAVAMGLPTLGGSFVGGDDHRLILNHVYVNHPSWEHAWKLFTIPHRDLYQPLPLLSFSAEFAIANALGLFDDGVEGGVWLFHLTNVLLHAVNGVLVWLLMLRLYAWGCRGRATEELIDQGPNRANGCSQSAWWAATVVALLFAAHPLQTEVVAWTNGRMMLLSTLFALVSLLLWASWLVRPRPWLLVMVVVAIFLCGISKVRIGLPVLFMVVWAAGRIPLRPRIVVAWLIGAALTAVFVVINVASTAEADLFSGAAEHLHGPRVVRVLLALSLYARKFAWPAGLASYYPTPPQVSWSNVGTVVVLAGLIPTLLLGLWAALRVRAARLGLLWFAATLAATLPIVPARNILAADRYMYLPIIGLLWAVVASGHALLTRWGAACCGRWTGRALTASFVAIIVVFVGVCWNVGWYYATPIRKTQRITELFPDAPRVWERLGWSYLKAEMFDKAVYCAKKDIHADAPMVRGGAYQLLGMCALRRGDAERALSLLHQAIEIDPDHGLAKYRLATAYDELDRPAEALPFYEAAAKNAPRHNPTINRLAALLRRLNRSGDARRLYLRALETNPYDLIATMGLVELDIEQSTPKSLALATTRLRTVLEWMPENVAAWTNLGVAQHALGRSADAVQSYLHTLKIDERHGTAALNVAQLYRAAGDMNRADRYFEMARESWALTVEQTAAVHDHYVGRERYPECVGLWSECANRFPQSSVPSRMLTWSLALAGNDAAVRAVAAATSDDGMTSPLLLAALAYTELANHQHQKAARQVDRLAGTGVAGVDARDRLLGALERYDSIEPNLSWTYCLAARLLLAGGNTRGASVAVTLCADRCADQPCRRYVEAFRIDLKAKSDEVPPSPQSP